MRVFEYSMIVKQAATRGGGTVLRPKEALDCQRFIFRK